MEDAGSTLEQQVAGRIKNLRARRGLSLEALANRSGVSRSMISLIERAESNSTANVLYKLAASLGVTLASLFAEEERPGASPVVRRREQQAWRDPATGYVRRNLSPPGYSSPIELVEVLLPPGARVAFDRGFRGGAAEQQVWVLEGTVEVTTGKTVHRLAAGDCLAMRVEGPTAFRNPNRQAARYLVALILTAAPRKAGASKRRRSR